MDAKPSTKKIGIVIILLMSFCSFIISISTLYAGQIDNGLSTSNNKIDIRFVVDVSVNMKKQDPNKTRVRALQKIIKSLPANSVSGVWAYGKYVNMLVPLGPTTEQWKKQAVYNLDKLGGYGNYRNLGKAIDKATYGWQDKKGYNKYIVVLTGGDLRVSSSKIKNAKSQLKLLTKTMAKLTKANIKVHALSFAKQSDNRLLKVIASSTNGNWYKVSSAKTLPKVVSHAYNVIAANNNIKKHSANYAANTKQVNKYIRASESKVKNSSNIVSKNIDKNITKNKANIKAASKKYNFKTAPKYSFKSKSKSNSKHRATSSLHKKFHSKFKGKSTKLKAVKNQKKLNLEYKNRKEMDFNWPSVHAG